MSLLINICIYSFVISGIVLTLTGLFWRQFITSHAPETVRSFHKLLKFHFSLISKYRANGTYVPGLKVHTFLFVVPYLIFITSIMMLILLVLFRMAFS